MILTTANLHLAMGAGAFIVSLPVFYSYTQSKIKTILDLAFFFVFISLYSFSLSIPYFIDRYDLVFLGGGYIIARIFLVFSLFYALKIPFITTNILYKKLRIPIYTVLFGGTLIALFSLVTNFQVPIIASGEIIFWNLNGFASLLLGIITVTMALIWVYMIYKSIYPEMEIWQKARLVILIVDGIAWAIADFVYAQADSIFEIYFAFLLVLLPMAITTFIYIYPKFKNASV
tara:strand:- start:979 stop:1671 length:693 start_codon:yes stop_codon:yes gene_type:complete